MKIGGSIFAARELFTDEGHVNVLRRARRGPAVVLVPGSFQDAAQWDGVVARLSEDLDLVIVELRGHGESWPPPRNGSIEQFAGDVLVAIDALSIDRFHVGGHSIGGMVALEVAREREAKVKGVLLVEGWTNHRAADDAFDGVMGNTLSAAQQVRLEESRQRATSRWSLDARKAFSAIWRAWDGYDFLCRTDLPVLEIYGDRGRPQPDHSALHIPERPNIELRWIEGASHALPFERPADVARAFMEFIARTN